MTPEELKAQGWVSPDDKKKVADIFMQVIKHADAVSGFQKLRSGRLGLTPQEEKLVPSVQEAKKILGIE